MSAATRKKARHWKKSLGEHPIMFLFLDFLELSNLHCSAFFANGNQPLASSSFLGWNLGQSPKRTNEGRRKVGLFCKDSFQPSFKAHLKYSTVHVTTLLRTFSHCLMVRDAPSAKMRFETLAKQDTFRQQLFYVSHNQQKKAMLRREGWKTFAFKVGFETCLMLDSYYFTWHQKTFFS